MYENRGRRLLGWQQIEGDTQETWGRGGGAWFVIIDLIADGVQFGGAFEDHRQHRTSSNQPTAGANDSRKISVAKQRLNIPKFVRNKGLGSMAGKVLHLGSLRVSADYVALDDHDDAEILTGWFSACGCSLAGVWFMLPVRTSKGRV